MTVNTELLVPGCSRAEKSLTFRFGETTPNPIGFPDLQGVRSARIDDWALGTYRLRCIVPLLLTRSPFGFRVEELRTIHSPATPMELPFPQLLIATGKSRDVCHASQYSLPLVLKTSSAKHLSITDPTDSSLVEIDIRGRYSRGRLASRVDGDMSLDSGQAEPRRGYARRTCVGECSPR